MVDSSYLSSRPFSGIELMHTGTSGLYINIVIFINHIYLSEQFSNDCQVIIIRLQLLWLSDWFKNLAPVYEPLKVKTKTNQDLHARFLLCFEQVTRNCYEFGLVHCNVCICCAQLVKVITLVFVLPHSIENSSFRKLKSN